MDFVAKNYIESRIQELKEQYTSLHQKMLELEQDKREHELVAKTLSGVPGDRRCYRLVGGVLVERTVGEVYPALLQSRDNIENSMVEIGKLMRQKEEELNKFLEQHGIRRKATPGQAGATQ